jgi:hypothetical protein
MNNNIQINFTLDTNNPQIDLGFEAWINDDKFFDTDHVTTLQKISVEIKDDDNVEHRLKFVLKNKKSEHTQIDEAGNIITDARLSLCNVSFDDIELGQLFFEKSIYTHDFNGTANETQNKFYGEMGCNGTVELKFATPVYLWLLENY